jgi:carboxypeptidase Q
MTSCRACCVCVLLVLCGAIAFPQITPELKLTTDSLAGSIFTGPYMSTLEELADSIGPRVTGSPAYNRAADWGAAQFRAAGLANVHFESFTIPNGWQRGPAQAQLVAPIERVLHIEPVGWSPSTSGDLRAPLALLSDLSTGSIQKNAQIRDHILLLDVEQLQAQSSADYTPALLVALPLLAKQGARAVLFPDGVPNNVLGDSSDIGYGVARVLPLPCGELGMEDNALLRRLLTKGDVQLVFRVDTRVTGPTEVRNVIGEIQGREKPGEWVILGAHLDSWDLGTGAQDNGSGTAMVIEAARAIHALGQSPRRTIRFALWGGEEPGLLGSTAYVAAHRNSDLMHCVMVVNTDDGTGHPWGWKLHGRTDVREAMQPISDTLLRAYSANNLSLDFSYDTDHGPFLLEGIPVLDLLPTEVHYNEIHHKPSDTFDKVDAVDAKADTAIVAITTYTMAELLKPIAPRIDHRAVDAMLKKTNMYGYLTVLGIWKP